MKKLFSIALTGMILAGCNAKPVNTIDINATSTDAKQKYSSIKLQTLGVKDSFFKTTAMQEPSVQFKVPAYTLSSDLSNVIDVEKIPDAAREKIKQNNFAVVMNKYSGYDKIYDLYSSDMQGQKLITSDLLLHTFHVLYDFSLRYLERDYFYAQIKELTARLIQESILQYQAIDQKDQNAELKELARRNIAFFTVAGVLLDKTTQIPKVVEDIVNQELDLIAKHEGFKSSPLFNYEDSDTPDNLKKEDYSQYVPRGHYTRSEELQNYFKGMMWYGRMNFPIKSYKRTVQALMATVALNKVENGLKLWNDIYTPTSFLVGSSDDLSVYDYNSVISKVWSDGFKLEDLNKEKVTNFINEIKKLPAPKINSSLVMDTQKFEEATQGFRLMGQRFVLDSYIFQQLVHDKVTNRFMPSGLDVMTALGSQRAEQIMDARGESKYANYKDQVSKLKTYISGLTAQDWQKNIYYYWLYTTMPLLENKTNVAQYPQFMQGQAWQDKQLNTSLGFWTELKHDTILYAKQSYTLTKGAMPNLDKPVGYIEPELKLYVRLYNLAVMLQQGLKDRGLNIKTLENLGYLVKDLETVISITKKELANEPRTEEDYNFIKTFGKTLESLADFKNMEIKSSPVANETDEKMAVIADVHSDPNSGEALEEGVGKAYPIYAIIPNESGNPQLTIGGVFSHYEFTQPMSARLTDEQWQTMVSNGQPKSADWLNSYILFNN